MTQAIRLIALFFFVLGLVTSVPSDQAMAQISEEAQGAAKLIAPNMGQNSKARFLENVNRKSPRAAIASFVAAMTALPDPNYDQAYECMEFTSVASVTKATKQRLANDLLRIIGHVDDPTLPENIAYYPAEGVPTVGFWVFFPRPSNVADSVPATLIPGSHPKALINASVKTTTNAKEYAAIVSSSRRYRVQLANDDETGAWRFIAGPQTAELALLLSGSPWLSESLRSATENLTMTIGERIQWSVPSWMLAKTLGLRLWQWLGIAILLGIGVLLDILMQVTIHLSARVIRPLQDTMVHAKTLNRAAWPTGLAVAAIFWGVTVHWLALTPASASVISLLVTIFAIGCVVWAGFRIADLAGEIAETKAAQEKSVIEDLTVPIVRKTIKLLIVSVALIVVAWEIGASVNAILTALGIFGAGIMLASRDVIGHYFGSLTLVSAKPFDVGDWVIIGDIEGTVEELGFRATKIRTFSNSEVTIPNSTIIQMNIDNYGRRQYRRWKTLLNLPFGTPPELVEAFCEGIRELVRIHPSTRKDYYQVWLHDFGEDSLEILLYIFYEAPDWESELRERNRLALDIIRLAKHLGVTLSIPSRAIQFEGPLGISPSDDSTPPRQESAHADIPTKATANSENGTSSEQAGRAAAAAITANAPWRKPNPESTANSEG